MSAYKTKVGSVIREARKSHGLTQQELADKLDLSRQSIINWEAGVHTPTQEKMEEIESIFGINFETIIFDKSEEISNEKKIIELLEIIKEMLHIYSQSKL